MYNYKIQTSTSRFEIKADKLEIMNDHPTLLFYNGKSRENIIASFTDWIFVIRGDKVENEQI